MTGADSGTVTLRDLASGQETESFVGGKDEIYTIALSPDQTMLATGDRQARILLYGVPQ